MRFPSKGCDRDYQCGLGCSTTDKAGGWPCLLWPPHAQGSPGKNFIKYFLCLRHLTYKDPLSPRCIYNSEMLSKLAKKLSGFRPKCVWVQAFSPVSSVQFSSFSSVPTLCNPMDCSMPGFPAHHQLPEFTQTHVHWVSDASNHLILCHPLLLLPSIFSSIRVFSNESVLRIR